MPTSLSIDVKRGLDLPLAGAPEQVVHPGPEVETVALLGIDYPGVSPTLAVAEGDRVRKGQTVFADRKRPAVRFTAPAAGVVSAIHRGARRALLSVVLQRDESVGEETFAIHDPPSLARLPGPAVREALQVAGLWPALRTRPFNRVPEPDSIASAVFVTAIDTNPWAADPSAAIARRAESFRDGLRVLARLSEGPTYLCKSPDTEVPMNDDPAVQVVDFRGPHPAGLPGTHIHFLHPVAPDDTVWHIGYQDVIAVGELFATGRLFTERVVALGGPCIDRPRLLATDLGADIVSLLSAESLPPERRVLSGSVLDGRRATGPLRFLGRYHLQVSVIHERRERSLLGWLQGRSKAPGPVPGLRWHSRPELASTALRGQPGGMLPTEVFERVLPLDIPAVPLLRALLAQDTETARDLGCLELAEEDLALCSYVCPAKYDYGAALRANLELIERGG